MILNSFPGGAGSGSSATSSSDIINQYLWARYAYIVGASVQKSKVIESPNTALVLCNSSFSEWYYGYSYGESAPSEPITVDLTKVKDNEAKLSDSVYQINKMIDLNDGNNATVLNLMKENPHRILNVSIFNTLAALEPYTNTKGVRWYVTTENTKTGQKYEIEIEYNNDKEDIVCFEIRSNSAVSFITNEMIPALFTVRLNNTGYNINRPEQIGANESLSVPARSSVYIGQRANSNDILYQFYNSGSSAKSLNLSSSSITISSDSGIRVFGNTQADNDQYNYGSSLSTANPNANTYTGTKYVVGNCYNDQVTMYYRQPQGATIGKKLGYVSADSLDSYPYPEPGIQDSFYYSYEGQVAHTKRIDELEQSIADIQGKNHHNLLKNAWFRDNSIGATSGTITNNNENIIIDEWYSSVSGNSFTVNSDSIQIGKQIYQPISEDLKGKYVTLSVKLKDDPTIYTCVGLITVASNQWVLSKEQTIATSSINFTVGIYCDANSDLSFRIETNSTLTIESVKMEIGQVATLSYETYSSYNEDWSWKNLNSGGGFTVSNTEPKNKKMLWIDTTSKTGGLKYYNGTAWVGVPVQYT